MTHSELVNIGYKWCLKYCGFATTEIKTLTKEQPDVIGFNQHGTFLLEAKVSRSDFLADKKKSFRVNPKQGVGDWRFYIAPVGLIKQEELPNLWGLIEVNEKGKITNVYNPFGIGNFYFNWLKNEKSNKSEWYIMYSLLRRLKNK